LGWRLVVEVDRHLLAGPAPETGQQQDQRNSGADSENGNGNLGRLLEELSPRDGDSSANHYRLPDPLGSSLSD
jgi:hypothetical protein